ncbi:hypothetical protein Ndes2526B_g09345 [Nannochloris sp. 'desiccata']|nr:hypothetical protein KSW81_003626 [Chlorella desiccata (nom. nud.)]KAH7616033.1 hypothetical protein NADE_000868 [Chlorella desiccata (nom. nud.)]
MKVVPVTFAAFAGWVIISKLVKRGKGKERAVKPALEPEGATKLPNIIEEQEQDPSEAIEATPTHKRRASGSIPATSDEKEHKIKAMKMKNEAGSAPATPMVLRNTDPSTSVEQAAEEVESIPSPPLPQPPIAAPPAAPIALSSEFAAESTKGSAFGDGDSVADSQDSTLSRAGSLKRWGSKVKDQLRKASSRKNSNSSQ